MSSSCINAQSYGLRVFRVVIEKLNGERFTPHHAGTALTEQVFHLSVPVGRHQRMPGF